MLTRLIEMVRISSGRQLSPDLMCEMQRSTSGVWCTDLPVRFSLNSDARVQQTTRNLTDGRIKVETDYRPCFTSVPPAHGTIQIYDTNGRLVRRESWKKYS